MFKIDIPMDPKEAARIQRRRQAEEERKQRIFNPKARIYGKDYKGLSEQIEEKRSREQQEQQRNDAFAQELIRQDLIATEIDRRLHQDRTQVLKSYKDYQREQQKFEDRREFDLNDTNSLRHSFPARLHDEDPRCGPSSLQKFEGEDLSYKARIQAQAAQRRLFLEAQMEEKRRSEADLKRANEIWEQRLRETDLRAISLWSAEIQAQQAVKRTTAEYNLALANEIAERKMLERKAEEEATLAHILNMCQSELLTETVDATSVGGPHQVSKDRFKGYSAERIAMIREEQRRQVMDQKKREAEARHLENDWDKTKRREDIARILLEREILGRRRDLNREMASTNLELAREQGLRQEYLNRILYTSAPTEDYFDQFNTTTR